MYCKVYGHSYVWQCPVYTAVVPNETLSGGVFVGRSSLEHFQEEYLSAEHFQVEPLYTAVFLQQEQRRVSYDIDIYSVRCCAIGQ